MKKEGGQNAFAFCHTSRAILAYIRQDFLPDVFFIMGLLCRCFRRQKI